MLKKILYQPFLLLTGFSLLISGCTKDVTNIKLPETTPKLVVGCFISPQDTLITVTLTRSNPIWGPNHNSTNNTLVADASISISNGIISASLLFNSNTEQYELQSILFSILPGQTYYLNISTPAGESVSASCTVPASNLTSLTVDFVDTSSNTYKKINVKWHDISGQINYYRVYAEMEYMEPIFTDTASLIMYTNISVQSDNGKDGNEMAASFETGYTSVINGVAQTLDVTSYDIYLMNIDVEYYNYQYSLDHYTYGDPFSEPILIYTNINGGLGIFAAYNTYYQKINI